MFWSAFPQDKFDLVWDRGSMVVINAEDRLRYVQLILALLATRGEVLIECFIHDDGLTGILTWDNFTQNKLDILYPTKTVELMARYDINDQRKTAMKNSQIYGICYRIK